jgi:FkbM family methyltransferase
MPWSKPTWILWEAIEMGGSKRVLDLAAWAARHLPMPIKRLVYRIPPLASLIRRGLNRAAPVGLTQVQVAAGGLAGWRLWLDLQAEKDYWLGTYEPELQATLSELVQPGMVAYDVGANIGYISLLLARQVGQQGKVYAFEALPANLERLRLNLALNELSKNVIVIPAAVVECERPVRFLVGPSGGMGKADGSAGREDVAYSGAIDIDGLSLDTFVFEMGNPPPQVVKMDIEGGEVLALPGMLGVLEQIRPLLLLELHGLQAAQVVWETLTRLGYRLCRMAPGYPPVKTQQELDWKAYLVAIPSSNEA